KRYYCDYCDKSFADNPTNRKNHLSGVQHKIAKQNHYDQFKDPKIILMENFSKKPCHKFQQDGVCRFGEVCKYSHLTSNDIEYL
ncbi:hypothetical protein HELRODRAFT_146232, partial [Helobdella robusta]|uniref:Zinc finger matrin-type protein 5 n=1 Tax=Helobdella robusta TaxID=6412 RepID=T1EJR0_HELRO